MNSLSALETNKFQLSRRSFFRGAIAAIPLAAIPAGAAIAQQAQPALKRSEVLLKTMHDRAVASCQRWNDLPSECKNTDDDAINGALRAHGRWCDAMRQIPAETAAAAKLKIAVGSLTFAWSYQGSVYRSVSIHETAELKEQGEIELMALS
jgi:hypothetical protein